MHLLLEGLREIYNKNRNQRDLSYASRCSTAVHRWVSGIYMNVTYEVLDWSDSEYGLTTGFHEQVDNSIKEEGENLFSY